MKPIPALTLGVIALVLVPPLRPCTTMCLVRGENIVVANNYDYYALDGRVMVNRRGLCKTAFWTNSGLQWISRFGSLTFNQWGHEFPNGGINEARLVVFHMMLDGSQYPNDTRPSITETQWIQYQLDCSASVAEVVASDQHIRIHANSTPLHFFVADRTGRCAVIEFLGGHMVVHTDDTLPVAALTNHTYATSLAYAAVTSPDRTDHVSSLGRFVQAAASVTAFAQTDVADPISYAFAALDNVNQPNWTRWNTVIDIARGCAFFRTQSARSIKQIRLEDLDFRPDAPIRTLDINTNAVGLLTPQSIYSPADNLAVLLSVYRQTASLANVSYSYIQQRAAFPDSVRPISVPFVAVHPLGQTVSPGADVTFVVSAFGEGTLTYQWFKDDVLISEATGTTLDLPHVSTTHAGVYTVVVANEAGSVTSEAAALEVPKLPAIITLAGLSCTYDGACKSVSVATTPPGLETSVTYGGTSTSPSMPGVYTVVATVNDLTFSGSASDTLTILPVVRLSQTGPAESLAGASATFAADVTAGAQTRWQWQVQRAGSEWVDVAGATQPTFTLPSVQAFHAGLYRAIATVGGASAPSETMTLHVAPADPSAARLLNLSTRALCLTGDNVIIPGFVISGSGTKRLLIRAVGPELVPFGISAPLPNPRIALKRKVGEGWVDHATNDDWEAAANAAEIAAAASSVFAFDLSTGSTSSALLLDLPSGQYTAIASDCGSGTGIGIVELYDIGPDSSGTHLVNIANRGYVGTGNDLMIPGFVVSPEGPKTFLIRAVGPGLEEHGVTGVLADPQLAIHRRAIGSSSDERILTNDNWGENGDAEATARTAAEVYAFPLSSGSKDAAFVVTLTPAAYTVHVTGVSGGTGIALVEIYVVE